MSQRILKDPAASVRQRLLNLAHQEGKEFQLVLTRFGIERLLFRLSRSPHAGDFLLKGAMLFVLWNPQTHRPTQDLDLAGRGESSLENLVRIFRGICESEHADDGLRFDPLSVTAERMQELRRYAGTRVRLTAHLAAARIPLQVDVGFGDAVTPRPVLIDFPTLLGHPAPRLKAYPQATVVAEKFQAMVFLGMANTRMKDFYDLWLMARSFDFSGTELSGAIRATFERRETPIPSISPVALTPEFSKDSNKIKAWSGFLRKSRLVPEPDSLADVCSLLDSFLLAPAQAAAARLPFESSWPASGPWR